MRKAAVFAQMTALVFLLFGCGGGTKADEYAALQDYYASRDKISLTVAMTCDFGEETQEYTLSCDYENGGNSTVTIEKPDNLAGVSAKFDGDECTLIYDGLSFAAGDLGSGELTPATCIPRLLSAVCEGYMMETNSEELDGRKLWRVVFDTTGKYEQKIDCTVWFAADYTPVKAEISEDGEMIFKGQFTNVEFGDTISE